MPLFQMKNTDNPWQVGQVYNLLQLWIRTKILQCNLRVFSVEHTNNENEVTEIN